MVGDDDGDATRLERLDLARRGDAVVDGDDESDVRLLGQKAGQGSFRHAVSLCESSGNKSLRHPAQLPQRPHEDRRCAYAVGVVIAEDDYLAPVPHERRNDRDGLPDTGGSRPSPPGCREVGRRGPSEQAQDRKMHRSIRAADRAPRAGAQGSARFPSPQASAGQRDRQDVPSMAAQQPCATSSRPACT